MVWSKIVSISLFLLVCSSGIGYISVLTTTTNSPTTELSESVNSLLQTPISSRNEDSQLISTKNSALQSVKDIPTISPSSQAVEQAVDSSRLFWVPDVSTYPYEFYQINATLKVNGPHSLIYSNTTAVSDPELLDMNDSFESLVYPTITDFFGTPPDIDGNNKIILLVYDIDEIEYGFVAGFFYSLNQYLNTELHPSERYSNEAEILHIDILAAGNMDTVAHEFQHLIHFGHDDDEETWFEEGASMFAEYLIGGDAFSGGVGTDFQDNPDVSLTYWDLGGSSVLANYGASYTFFLYLAEQYGGNLIIKDLVERSVNGITSIENSLIQSGYDVPFVEVFRNWTIANFLDDTSFADGAYGYYNDSVLVNTEYTYVMSPLPRTENSVPFWGTDYLKFSYPSELPFTFEFQSESSDGFLVSIIMKNTTTIPLNTEVIPIMITPDGFGNFSTSELNITADEIYVVVSAYTEAGTPDHDDENPAPAQEYWFIVNPEGIYIAPGTLIYLDNILNLSNITVVDSHGFVWVVADGATYEILSSTGETTGITGTFVYDSENQSWQALNIDLGTLSQDEYKVKYMFYNTTSTGITYSEIFTTIISTTQTTSASNSTNTIIPGFLAVFLIITMGAFTRSRKRK
ncbi:hypothetical protein CEE45_02635 [Candidatus Heimdallarchaeota archaeon B3_Heim]|nr:MAG: hypothetical protein CEE45_02635 [Candidatus Heimdallarchaeota archaeon B3_Heim]